MARVRALVEGRWHPGLYPGDPALDRLEECLSGQPYLLGKAVTEPDWHLFCTLVRFDAAYHPALRCSRRRLMDYPALAAYTRRLFEYPGVAGTVDLESIRLHYFDDHPEIDRRILPVPPAEDFRSRDPDALALALGTLDDDLGVRPQAHRFVDSRAPWYEIGDHLPQYRGEPSGR